MVGFSGIQIVHAQKIPEKWLTPSSTIEIFKDKELFENIREAEQKLLVQTNAGNNLIMGRSGMTQ